MSEVSALSSDVRLHFTTRTSPDIFRVSKDLADASEEISAGACRVVRESLVARFFVGRDHDRLVLFFLIR